MTEILILFALFALNGFFSMAEMAVVSARKARLKAMADDGHKGPARALKVAENPGAFLSTIQIAITLIGTLSGAFGGATIAESLAANLRTIEPLAPYASTIALALVILGITFFSIVIGELVPKQIALSRPEAIASWITYPVSVIQVLFWPIEKFLSGVTKLFLKILRVDPKGEPSVTEEEIRVMIQEGARTGAVRKSEGSMVEGVFYLGERRIEAFMTHRSEMEWLPLEAEEEDIKAFLHMRYRYSTIPVCNGNLDEILGEVDTYALLVAMMEGNYKGLKRHLKKPLYIPGSLTAIKALEIFRKNRARAGIVLDEYGGVEGIVDIQALLDEVLGSDPAANENSPPDLEVQEDGSYLVEGRMDISAFCDSLGVSLEEEMEDSFHTVAGLVLYLMGRIPQKKDKKTWQNLEFEVAAMDGNRIDEIIVRKALPETPPAELTAERD